MKEKQKKQKKPFKIPHTYVILGIIIVLWQS